MPKSRARRMSREVTMAVGKDFAPQDTAGDSWSEAARSLASRIADDARPRAVQAHLVRGGSQPQLLVVDGTRLYDLPADTAAEIESVLALNDEAALSKLLTSLGLDAPPAIDEEPLKSPPLYALSLAVAQKCNLGCTYCYAQQGAFGGPAKQMSLETACRSVDLLLAACPCGGRGD